MQVQMIQPLALKPGATRSVAIFALAVLGVVLIGSFPSLLPTFSGRKDLNQALL